MLQIKRNYCKVRFLHQNFVGHRRKLRRTAAGTIEREIHLQKKGFVSHAEHFLAPGKN